MGKRDGQIDAVRAAAISLVVLSHIFGAMGPGFNPVWNWFAPFMVPLFFLVSGYLAWKREPWKRYAFSAYVKKRAGSLLIPYVGFSLAASVVRMGVTYLTDGPVRENLGYLTREFVTCLGTGTLWFLPVMFLSDMMAFLLLKRSLLVQAAAFLLSVLLVSTNFLVDNFYRDLWICDFLIVFSRSAAAVGIVLLGYHVLPELNRKKSRSASAVMVAGSFAVTVMISRFISVDFRTLQFGRYPLLFYVDAVAAGVFLLEGYRLLAGSHRCPVLSYIGQNTLVIMGTHTEWFLLNIVQLGLAGVLGPCQVIGTRYYGECGIIFVLLMLMEYGIAEGINRYVPWLAGKPGKMGEPGKTGDDRPGAGDIPGAIRS